MPHDVMLSEALSTPLPDEVTEQEHRKPTDILRLMKEAGRALVASTKRLAGKALVTGLLSASALSLAPNLAEAQGYATVYSYSNSIGGCQPHDSNPYPCGFADVQFVYNTATQAFSGTLNGHSITTIGAFANYLEYVGYQPVGWNGVGVATSDSDQLSLGSPPVNVATEGSTTFVGYDRGFVVSTGSTVVEYAWSASPGTWSVGAANPKTLGGRGIGQAKVHDADGPSLTSPFVPGGASPGTVSSICRPGVVMCGDPVNVATGGLFEQVDDYKTTGPNPLGFSRYYNNFGTGVPTYASSLGSELAFKLRPVFEVWRRFDSCAHFSCCGEG